ncbi:MAG: gliding motility-associated C-terminal domain-containing protein [Flavobacteriales bacterium]|nr:gliding motility-associated C-terminal domain-containing protein [Flavobacteriales bacterium]
MKTPKLLLLLLSCISITSFGQLQDANWHFGQGNAVLFEDDALTLYESTINNPIDRTPSVMSTPLGELLYFADEENVFAADNSIMPNGTFSFTCDGSIFIPRADSLDQYYFVRSLGFSGMDYSVVDGDLNDGLGDIIEDEKEIEFFSLGGELMAVPKGLDVGYWLISADNDNGTGTAFIRVFDVNAEGIFAHSEFSVEWPLLFFQNEMDDAIISPDCSKIACSYKGHLVGLCEFDSEIGEVTSASGGAVDTENGFFNIAELAFSPNSDYLYTIGDFNEIQQFDVSIFEELIVDATAVTIETSGSNTWHDIKLAPDGKIYLMNLTTNALDVIENPNEPASDIVFTESVLELNNTSTTYFPNTPNVICGQFLYLEPQTVDVCIGETTQFNFFYNSEPDSLFWEFGDPDSGDDNFSEILNPTHFYEFPGSYNVVVDAWLDSLEYNFELTANVYTYPDPQLGADVTICEGEELILDAGNALQYDWTPNGSNQTYDVTESGTYTVIASNGPCSASDEIEVTVIPALFMNLSGDLFPCDEEPVTITASTEVTWQDGSFSDSFTTSQSGTYFGTISNECFTVTDTAIVDYIVIPPFDLVDAVTGCYGDSIEIFTGVPDATVEWTADWGLEFSGEPLVITTSGTYEATVNYFGCEEVQTVIADINDFVDPELIVMPNIFTPNGDNRNNIYRPILVTDPTSAPCNIPNFEADMRIYNRWGGQITDGGCTWDGQTENNNDVGDGVYYFVVEIKANCFSQASERTINGSFTLTR